MGNSCDQYRGRAASPPIAPPIAPVVAMAVALAIMIAPPVGLGVAPAAADYVVEQSSNGALDCVWPVVASSGDGVTMLAWVELGDDMWNTDVVISMLIATFASETDPPLVTSSHGPGQRPALCWSREGFTLAFASGEFLLAYQSDLGGFWDLEVFDVMTPYEAFSIDVIDLWGNAYEGAGAHVLMSVGGRLWLPELDHKVLYAGRNGFGWTDFDVVAEGIDGAGLPQIAYAVGPYGPLPRVYYLGNTDNGPGLVYKTREFDEGWVGPVPVPGAGGEVPGPVGSEFDATAHGFDRGILGCGHPPTCPCNTIHFTSYEEMGGWQDPDNLTVEYGLGFDWPMSPNLGIDPDDRVHAFWYQLASSEYLEPHLRTLEYWVRDEDGWSDQGSFLADQNIPALGSRVAMSLTPDGLPIFAWTRKDTVDGEPQPRAVWIARPRTVVAVPEETIPRASPVLTVAPNPLNPQTRISYDLAQAQQIALTVYDLNGRLVTVLEEGYRQAGVHTLNWQGSDATGRAVASGAYLVRLETASGVEARKVSVVR